MAKIITTASIKGGVAKTTTTIFLAQALLAKNYTVCVVDLDHNNNLTDYFLRSTAVEELEAFNFLAVAEGLKEFPEVLYRLENEPNLAILPATPALIKLAFLVQTNVLLPNLLASALSQNLASFDFVLIDTPPSLGIELTIGLLAADLVITPLSDGRWLVQGYDMIAEELSKIALLTKEKKKHLALPSMITDKKATFLNDLDYFGPNIFKTHINRSESIKNAGTNGTKLNPNSRAYQQFVALAGEVEELCHG